MEKSFLYTYRQKLLFSFILLFTFIVVTVAIFQNHNEKRLKSGYFQDQLTNYAELVASNMANETTPICELTDIFPSGLRITVIDTLGTVVFDNKVSNNEEMENHIDRPEVKEALAHSNGFDKRHSNTLNEDYYYLAIKRDNKIIRASMAYTQDLERTYLRSDLFFLYFIIALFIAIVFSLFVISSKLSKAIVGLRDFSLQKNPNFLQTFPEGELGDIGRRIVILHEKNTEQKQNLQAEKDKLIKHFHNSSTGIAIFSNDNGLVYNNSLFVQYAGVITEGTFEINLILFTEAFKNIKEFIDKKEGKNYTEILQVGERNFDLKAIVFDDFSFEIIIADITLSEKNRKIKHDMTQNIAHELKTPVSAIMGYLETLQNLKVSPEKQQHFLKRAKLQADRLSDLVTDIAIITKMEESPNLYPKEKALLNDIIDHSSDSSKLKVNTNTNGDLYIIGNKNLLQTIFQNLIDNANRYAGDDAEIFINCYLQDDNYYYFSVYDTGDGIDECYLTRIFERFYRVDEGRNRNNGGTGLGLSLVKNAILMHNGTVQAKNRAEGGLEFLFTLSKQ